MESSSDPQVHYVNRISASQQPYHHRSNAEMILFRQILITHDHPLYYGNLKISNNESGEIKFNKTPTQVQALIYSQHRKVTNLHHSHRQQLEK